MARTVRYGRDLGDAASWHVQPVWKRRWEPPLGNILQGPFRSQPLGVLTADRAAEIAARRPEIARATIAGAESAVAGKVRFFGYPTVELSRPVDYSFDPLTARTWPARHAKFIDYRHAGVGDPKWIWELNRCQELPVLVQAWLLTKDPRFADEALRRMENWTRQQPPGRGIAWSSGFEAGVRGISLALAFDGLRGYENLDEERRRACLRTLHQHAEWIRFDPSTHSSANNHRIGELAGLATIGLLAPELASAAEAKAWAFEQLALEADRQISSDGTGVEQAFAYHLFIVDLLLMVVALLVARSEPVPLAFTSALDRSADALWGQVGGQDAAPTYGDADDGRAARLDPFEFREVRGVAAGLAACLGHGGARLVAGSLDASALWLFGPEGAARFDSTVPAPEPGNIVLPDAGLVILRSGRRRLVVDVGPLGYLSLAAHGHADALQVTLSDGSRQLVGDPGAGSYFGHPDWRRRFRGTRFHATVEVDGEDQSQAGGPFFWDSHAKSTLLRLDLDAGLVIAKHDGYLRLEHPVLHQRAVLLEEDFVVVYDRLHAATSPTSHQYRQTWPLHPSLVAEQAGPGLVRVTENGAPRLQLAFASSTPAEVALVRGVDDPFEGWWSPRLEEVIPAWHCTLVAESSQPITDLVALLWIVDGLWPDPEVAIEPTSSGARIELTTSRQGRHTLDFDLAGRVPGVARSTPPQKVGSG